MALDGCLRSVETAQKFFANRLERSGYSGVIILEFDQNLIDDIADLFDAEFEFGRETHAAETSRMIELSIGGDEVFEPDPNPVPRGRLRNRVKLARSFCDDLAADYLFGQRVFLIPSQGHVLDELSTYLEFCFQKGKESSGRSVLRTIDQQEIAV